MTAAPLRAVLVLAAVFAVGVAAGVAFERHRGGGGQSDGRAEGPSSSPLHSSPAPSSGSQISPHAAAVAAHRAALADLERTVGLDENQVERIHRLMARRQGVVNEVWLRLRPEVESAMDEVHAEIAELLRPDQRERYHRWLQQRRQEGWAFRVHAVEEASEPRPGAVDRPGSPSERHHP